jgi:hypothetical protein
MTHHEVATKFSEPVSRSGVRSAKILNLQESVAGPPARMTLDGNDGGGWVPGQSGTDPNGSGSIDVKTLVDS